VFRLLAAKGKQFCGSSILRWDLKKVKTVTICYMHILTYRTERQSRNMEKNQSRYQWHNSILDDILQQKIKNQEREK